MQRVKMYTVFFLLCIEISNLNLLAVPQIQNDILTCLSCVNNYEEAE